MKKTLAFLPAKICMTAGFLFLTAAMAMSFSLENTGGGYKIAAQTGVETRGYAADVSETAQAIALVEAVEAFDVIQSAPVPVIVGRPRLKRNRTACLFCREPVLRFGHQETSHAQSPRAHPQDRSDPQAGAVIGRPEFISTRAFPCA